MGTWVFMPLVLIVSYGLIGVGYGVRQHTEYSWFKHAATGRIDRIRGHISGGLDEVLRDLQYLAGNVELKRFLATPGHENRLDLNETWRHFAETHSIYDQIRLIDPAGMERRECSELLSDHERRVVG